ncbi:MAG: hypothetical protein WA823_12400 [Candidatus Acidiferrales bacterium]
MSQYTVRLARPTFLDRQIEANSPEEAKALALKNFRSGEYSDAKWETLDVSMRAAIFSIPTE